MQIHTTVDDKVVEVKVGLDHQLWYWDGDKGQRTLAKPGDAIKFIEEHCTIQATKHELEWLEIALIPPPKFLNPPKRWKKRKK